MTRVLNIIIAVIALLANNVKAQYISLNDSEISHLQKKYIDSPVVTEQWLYLANSSLKDKAQPIDTIFSQGLLKGNPKKTVTNEALKDVSKIYSLCVAYRLTDRKKYLTKAIEMLQAWATINKPQGNAINETKLDGIYEGYDLIKNFVPKIEKQIIEDWLKTIAQKHIRVIKVFNNYNSHRIKIIGQIAYLLNDSTLKKYAKQELEKQLNNNLLPDGGSFDFTVRDAFHYHIYTLEPLLSLSKTLQRAEGLNYYEYLSASGSSIKKSVHFLLPYVNGEKEHYEFVKSTVAFDRERGENNEKGFIAGTLFKPNSAKRLLSLATYFEPSLEQQIKIQLDKWLLIQNAFKVPLD